jgi:hypothetical protein
VIVVLGSPIAAPRDEDALGAAGSAVSIAEAAAAAGSSVEIVGRIGDDEPGDAVILDLARRGIGHAALLRVGGLVTQVASGGGVGLDAGDVELALRYLPGYRVVVATDGLSPEALAAAVAAATWAEAHFILIGDPGAVDGLPDASTVLQPPDTGENGGFASLVGSYAAAIDRGVEPDRAFADLAALFNPERVGQV